jgi:nicotinate-nucleotide--dimethylbenzimidazole phosphoribosyltransferase
VTALLEVGTGVGWPDIDAAAEARRVPTRPGRFAELVEWLAGVQGRFPPQLPHRVRLFRLGMIAEPVAGLAERHDVGVRGCELDADPRKAFEQGLDAADREIDEGAHLVVLAGHDDTAAPAVLISVLTDAEPVALLPRGADAVETGRWVAAAEQLRDGRREVAHLRNRPDELLAALGSPAVAAAAGFGLRAAARRTAVVLDGDAVLAAALLCVDSQPRAREWWQLADTSADRAASSRVTERLERTPLLDLRSGNGDGTAGLLAVEVLRAAVLTGVDHD